jgi:uncharacterized protein YceH (UPF0502 family)
MRMKNEFSLIQARVIGCLLEKEVTTPDQYPLSLNALCNACNQKSNRDPVMSLAESEVQAVIDELTKQRLISEKSSFGSRVSKYQHRFCNTEFGELKLSPQELGILSVMLLRGPQTPGELRTRTERYYKFADVGEVEATLNQLMEREDGPFIEKLEREPGKRDSRYVHLLADEEYRQQMLAGSTPASEQRASSPALANNDRLTALENRVSELEEELRAFKALLE